MYPTPSTPPSTPPSQPPVSPSEPPSVEPSVPPQPIRIFRDPDGPYEGNMRANGGGGSWGDGQLDKTTAKCQAEANRLGYTCSVVTPFLTYTGIVNTNSPELDSPRHVIAEFPTMYNFDPDNVPIMGPNGNILATSWNDALSGNYENYPISVGLSSTTGWWTGSNADGTESTNCHDWSYASRSMTGKAGYEYTLMNHFNGDCGSTDRDMMCVCIP